MQITPDQLQNELLNISHHLNDVQESLEEGDTKYAMAGINDIQESVARLSEFLSDPMANEIDRMAEDME